MLCDKLKLVRLLTEEQISVHGLHGQRLHGSLFPKPCGSWTGHFSAGPGELKRSVRCMGSCSVMLLEVVIVSLVLVLVIILF